MQAPQPTSGPSSAAATSRWQARAWRALGAASVAIGVINAFIPLLPTTVFLIVGAWAWGKGAPEWRARLMAHPRFGPGLTLWLEHRMISRRGKRLCLVGLCGSSLLSAWMLDFAPVPSMFLIIGLTALGGWIAARPEPGLAAKPLPAGPEPA
jgi:uncharacterized membrane protein YbaN (DUF454 family)